MSQLENTPDAGINDLNVAQSAPFVRALVVRRLEQIWRTCDPHIQVQRNPETGLIMRPDPRFIEAGIRVLDRLAALYRLNNPTLSHANEESASEAGVVAVVRAQLDELEARLRSQD